MGRKRNGPGFEEGGKQQVACSENDLTRAPTPGPPHVNGFVLRAICAHPTYIQLLCLALGSLSLSQHRTDTDMLPTHVYLRDG